MGAGFAADVFLLRPAGGRGGSAAGVGAGGGSGGAGGQGLSGVGAGRPGGGGSHSYASLAQQAVRSLFGRGEKSRPGGGFARVGAAGGGGAPRV